MIAKKIDLRQQLIAPPLSERLTAGCTLLAPGQAVGQHVTQEREEILVILQGTAHIQCGDQTLQVDPGSLVFIPKNQTHNVLNTGADLLRYVYIVSSLAP